MDVYLTLRRNAGNTFSGAAVYEAIAGDYDFALDQNFAVRRILAGESERAFEKTHAMPDRYLDQTNALVYLKADIYRVAGDVPDSLKIEYEYTGDFSSDIAYNRISDEMIALDALYINFYPVPIARNTTEKIRPFQKFEMGDENVIAFGKRAFAIEGFEPYRVINCDEGCIKQFVKMCPFKLLAVDESKILRKEGGRATAYYLNEKEDAKAAGTAREASRIIEWYSENLFRGFAAPERMYFASYDAKKLGGFNRSITVELERFYPPDTLKGRHLLAHEIAHYWCISEPPAVWNEQMLAEGCAEWSYLLYALSKGRASFVCDYLYLAGQYFVNTIYTAIYNRFHRQKFYNPHLRGYRTFRDIYKKHGKGALERCIRHFAGIEIKTMESFLKAVETNEPAEIYSTAKSLATKNLT